MSGVDGTASGRPRGPWLVFGVWTLVVFTIVPFANDIQQWLQDLLGDEALFYGLLVAILVAVIAAVRWLKIHRRPHFLPCMAWFLSISVLIGAWGWMLRETAGAGHLLAFSILGALSFRALRGSMPDTGVYLAATLLTSVIGTIDEIVQWITPERVWDIADLGVNAGTGALIQLLIWKGIRPESVMPGVSRRSWQTTARWAMVQVVLLLVCLVNTPERISWYAQRIPGLDYLGAERKTRMVEYGHVVEDPEIGRFRSRLTGDELIREDHERGSEVGSSLLRHRRSTVKELVKVHPPWQEPLVLEAREHIAARNRARRKAFESDGDPEVIQENATMAFREQMILERYFGRTLESYGDMQAQNRQRLEDLQDVDADYESPAGEWLETRFSEAGARWGLITVLAGLFAADRLLARSFQRRNKEEVPG